MNDGVKIAATGIAVLGGVLLLGTATSWFGLVTQRPMAKYAEETRAQVYDTSRQFQQGVNRDVARYCRQWHEADGAGKKAVADLIASTLSTYQGQLTAANQQCAADTGAF
jgi:hypothetical protein